MKVIVVVVVGVSGNYQDMQLSHEQKQVTESCGMSIILSGINPRSGGY